MFSNEVHLEPGFPKVRKEAMYKFTLHPFEIIGAKTNYLHFMAAW
jgi:hypothetical protein